MGISDISAEKKKSWFRQHKYFEVQAHLDGQNSISFKINFAQSLTKFELHLNLIQKRFGNYVVK
jgi:hypothetical protein